MSESGDSFEEIEFEQSALRGSNSDQASTFSGSSAGSQESVFRGSSVGVQESSDSTKSDQHSTGESSATTMANSTDPAKPERLEDLEFELAWKTRDEIICSLNQHTALLSGLRLKAEAGEKIRKANGDLMVVLLNLPAKVDGRPRSFESPESLPDEGLNQMMLELSWEVRSRIVDTLMANHQVVLLDADSVTSECKAKLVDRNYDLVRELLKLRARTVAIPNDPSASKGDHLVDQTAKASRSQATSQAEEMATLETELEQLKVRLGEVDVGRNEATFTWELKGVEALLADDSKKQQSKLFYCGGIPWFLKGYLSVEDGVKWLSVYLHYKNRIIPKEDSWSVETSYEFRLLSSDPGADVVTIGENREFKHPDKFSGWGQKKFITVDKLRSGSFIKNDMIQIRAHLSVKCFERFFK